MEVIPEGSYTEQKVYTRPPSTYICDACGKDMGTNRGIELGMSFDRNDDTNYEEPANFCSFDCLHKYPTLQDSKRFTRQIRMADRHDLFINGFKWKDIAGMQLCKIVNCDLPEYKGGMCSEHLEEHINK